MDTAGIGIPPSITFATGAFPFCHEVLALFRAGISGTYCREACKLSNVFKKFVEGRKRRPAKRRGNRSFACAKRECTLRNRIYGTFGSWLSREFESIHHTGAVVLDAPQPYQYVSSRPINLTDPSGLPTGVEEVAVAAVCSLFVYDVVAGVICASLYDDAVKKKKIGTDPGLHKKHCYVACCLNKAHLCLPPGFNPTCHICILWELKGDIFVDTSDSIEDIKADCYGVYGSYLDNCAKHCDKLKV